MGPEVTHGPVVRTAAGHHVLRRVGTGDIYRTYLTYDSRVAVVFQSRADAEDTRRGFLRPAVWESIPATLTY